MKFLFVVPPFTGHVLPSVSVAQTLIARGHRAAWVAQEEVRALLPSGAELISLGPDTTTQVNDKRGFESLKHFYEDIVVPSARALWPRVARAIADYRPDVVVADQQAFAGALAARRCGVRWASFCTTSVTIADPLAPFAVAKQWLQTLMADVEREAGLTAWDAPDLSPELVVVFSTPHLAGAERQWPAQFRFVGPATQARRDLDHTPFPWHALQRRPCIFVSLGTAGTPSLRERAFYAATVDAFRDFSGQVIVVAPDQLLRDPPPHFIVRARVPQLALFEHVDAVVCHGGHNTVCEALAHGVPLVLAPVRHDQPLVAEQVVRAGAGLRLRYSRVTGAKLRAATDELLENGRFQEVASGLRRAFAAAGGAGAAADALEALS